MNKNQFWISVSAIVFKEWIQLFRDKVSLIILILAPLFQVTLFGVIVNTDPRHLPTALVSNDMSPFTRTLVKAFENTQYFDMVVQAASEEEAEELLAKGKVQFILTIPPDFSRDLVKGKHPQINLKADATNPMTTSPALSAASMLENYLFKEDLNSKRLAQTTSEPHFKILIEQKYNPASFPQYFSIPGLIGLSLSSTLMFMTLISVSREKDRGTLEGILTAPMGPLEVIIGKMIPFVIVAYLQIFSVLFVARWVFDVPMLGSVTLLLLCTFPFIIGCLMVGLFFSTIAKNQYQAIQLSNFYLMPNLLFTGFIYPYLGMPKWAQHLGEILPLTHYLRILMGVMLKGSGFNEISGDLFFICIFMAGIVLGTTLLFRRTLD